MNTMCHVVLEGGHLDATELMPNSLTWLTWRWGQLDAKMLY